MVNSSPSGSSSSSITEIALPDSSEAEQLQQQQQADCGSSSPAKDEDNSSSTVVATSNALADHTSLCRYHISWAIFKHLPDRVPYTWTTLEPKRFCIFQSEPCKINACRVAINIIAMLYPLNLSKFLIKSYHPLKEEERRKMAENWNIDVKNFMQRFCDDINKRWRTEVADRIHPLHFLDLLWESDDSESALLSDMASAFAEWFLIDFQFPQRNVIYQYFTKFFLVKGTDIEFDMKCFEGVSGSRLFNWSTPASPLRQLIANDMQSKLLGVNWSSILPEEALAAINGEDLPVATKLEGITSGGVLVATATSTAAMAAAVIEPIVKLCSDDGAICKDCKECFTDTVTKLEIFEKEIKKPLVEALKLAASNKILETELKTLQKEHSMLKDMVRDLEQIHEQKHSNATQQCGNGNSSSSSTNSNGNSNNSSNTNSNNSKSVSVAKNSNSSSSGTPTIQAENGNSTASKGTASSSSRSISGSASVGTVSTAPASKPPEQSLRANGKLNKIF